MLTSMRSSLREQPDAIIAGRPRRAIRQRRRGIRCTPYGGLAGAILSTATLALLLALGGCQELTARLLPAGTPGLHRAVAEGKVALVKRASRSEVDRRGPYGWTPLHFAAVYGAPSPARVLLGLGAHLDAVDHTGMTPLHWAARLGSQEMVELLLQRGAEVMARNKFDRTPLHEASTVPIAELLLGRGAELMARDIDGMTPLHTAPTKPVADLLIKKGADIEARARDGRTPMDMPPVPRPRVR